MSSKVSRGGNKIGVEKHRALCTVQVRTWIFSSAHGLFVLANCYTMAGLFFSGGSDHSDWEFITANNTYILSYVLFISYIRVP